MKFSKRFLSHNGQRIGVNYFTGPWIGIDPATIKIRPKNRLSFPREFWAEFPIENNTDIQTDYFEKDCIRLVPGHPYYNEAKAAASS